VSGINPGDKVVATGKERVEDGEAIRPLEAGAAPAQPAADSARPEGGTR